MHSSRSSSHLTHKAPAAPRSPSHSHHSDQSFLDEEETFDYCLSGDEEDPSSSSSPSTGLFRHEMFKTLLHKAKVTANMGLVQPPLLTASDSSDSNTRFFTERVAQQDTVPSPKLFLDTVQRQWSQPGSITNPSGLDKKLYSVEQEFEDLLKLPVIDPPMASLTSPSILPSDAAEGLRTEDK